MHEEESRDPRREANSHLKKAFDALDEREPDAVRLLFQQCVKADQRWARPHLEWAEFEAKLGETSNAQQQFDLALDKSPRAFAMFKKAAAVADRIQCQDRFLAYARTITPFSEPENESERLYLMGCACLAVGDRHTAISHFLSAITVHKCHRAAQRLALVPKSSERAIECLETLDQRFDPQAPPNWLRMLLADLATQAGNFSRAARYFRMMAGGEPSDGPNLIIIGAMKAATTALYDCIAQHPDMRPPVRKEIHYFDREPRPPIDWYSAHFPRKGASQFSCEATPNYYMTTTPAKIKMHFPECRFVLIVREPVDRAVSHFAHNKTMGFTPVDASPEMLSGGMERLCEIREKCIGNPKRTRDLVNSLRQPSERLNHFLLFGLYDVFLSLWDEEIQAGRMTIVNFDDFTSEPASVMAQIYAMSDLHPFDGHEFRPVFVGNYRKTDEFEGVRQTLKEFYAPVVARLSDKYGIRFRA